MLLTISVGYPPILEAQSIPPLVSEKCTGCHPLPRPDSMPRHAWTTVGETMTALMKRADVPIEPEEMDEIVAYYQANSPVRLEQIRDDYAEPLLNFGKTSAGMISFDERPKITGVTFTDIDGDGAEDDIVVTDANTNAVTWLRLEDGSWRETVLATITDPVDATAVDVDGDGDLDLGVSSMGFLHPTDDLIGEFHLLLNRGDGTFEHQVLAEGTPRITGSAAADFDDDGDIDFVLAMFGWRTTGGVGLLEQTAPGEFAFRTLVDMNGCMQVIANDANGDELQDFVALFTQQHEAIVQFVNRGGGEFDAHYITRARHPAFGSSSIRLHDLDGDGDEDILYTNGDMMDENNDTKPYHGVRWLENNGKGGYILHDLAGMPGCYDAEPVDLDDDGDLDVVISSLNFRWQDHDFPSLAWLENTGGFRNFVKRRIAYAPTNMAKIDVGDVDGDGKPDIVGGGMHVPGPLDRKGRITVWLGR